MPSCHRRRKAAVSGPVILLMRAAALDLRIGLLARRSARNPVPPGLLIGLGAREWTEGADARMNYTTPSRPAETLAPYATWRLSAACRQVDPELFFPVGTTGPAIEQVGQAKGICQGCSVREACLGWALRNQIAFGIWGGTTEEDRQALRRAFAQRVSHEG